MYGIQVISEEFYKYEDIESCFDRLLQIIDHWQKEGYKLTKIEGNVYYLEKGDKKYSVIIRNKDNDSIYF